MSSSSFGSSTSNSSSFIPDFSETPILEQIAQFASQYGQQQYQWAQQQFAANSVLTDQAVNNYLAASKSADKLAQNSLDRYTNVFQPQEDALIRDANSYASTPRIQQQMGAAESNAGQAGNAARINAEQTLQSYGIDPSSGRYADLEAAQRTQTAASQAAAGQQAELNTEATGRQLRSQAIQVGQQLPGQAVNALNSEVQSLSGAVNAKLANTNTGVNAFDSANRFLGTGMGLKYPPLGQRSGSSSSQHSSNSGGGGGKGSNDPGNIDRFGRSGGSGGGSGGGLGPVSQQSRGGYSGMPQYRSGPGIMNIPDTGGYDNSGAPTDYWGGSSSGDFSGGDYGSYTNYDPGGLSQFSDYSSQGMTPGDPYNDYGNIGGYDQSAYTNYDPSMSGFDSGGGSTYDTGGYGNTGDMGFGDSGSSAGFGDYSGVDTSGFGGSSDYGGYTDTGGYDSGYSGDISGGYSDTGGYAQGGAIPEPGDGPVDAPSTGGQVPYQASPSMGQKTDDVTASLNAGEFVIPRDVALWKGQEFFQKLIQQSRKNRMGAPAKPDPGMKSSGPPTFVSQG